MIKLTLDIQGLIVGSNGKLEVTAGMGYSLTAHRGGVEWMQTTFSMPKDASRMFFIGQRLNGLLEDPTTPKVRLENPSSTVRYEKLCKLLDTENIDNLTLNEKFSGRKKFSSSKQLDEYLDSMDM